MVENNYILYMGCSKCKKNQSVKDEVLKSAEFVEKGVIWFVIIWSIFGIYGFYSLIVKIL